MCGGSKIAAVVGEEFPELRQSPLPIVVAGDFFRDTPRTGARSLKQITGDAMNTHTAAAHSVRNGYGDGNVGARLVWNPRSRGGTEDGRWRYLYCRTRWESARGARLVVTARTSRGGRRPGSSHGIEHAWGKSMPAGPTHRRGRARDRQAAPPTETPGYMRGDDVGSRGG